MQGTFTSLACIIADTQSLLLTVVHGCVKLLLSRRSLVNKSEQIESTCLVDAAISFCMLQHLDPSVTIKSQVVSASFELEADHLFFGTMLYVPL